MYSPQLGRFLNPDPLAADPTIMYDNNWFGDQLTMMRNLYGYADNNPVNYIDPSGLDCTGVCFEIKKSKLLSCDASNIKKKNCGFQGYAITPKAICASIKESVEGKAGMSIDTCSGTEQVCDAQVSCSCEDKQDKKGQVLKRTYKGITQNVEKIKGCSITFDLKVKVKVGEGWEGTCKTP